MSTPREAPYPWERVGQWLWSVSHLVAGSIAVFSLWAWWYGDWKLAAFGNQSVPMAPSTAAMLLLLAIALALHQRWACRASVRVFEIGAAALAVVVALTVIGQTLAGLGSPWERWLAGEAATVRGITLGRMSPLTAGALLLAAASLFALQPGPTRRAVLRRAGKIAALVNGGFCALSALAYAAGAPLFYDTAIVPMALLTALAFVALNFALLLAGGLAEKMQDTFFGRPAQPAAPSPSQREKNLIFWLTTAVLFAVALASFWSLRRELTKQKTRLANELTAISSLKVGQITAWREERLSDARLLMRTPFLSRSLAALAANPRDLGLRGDLLAWLEQLNRTQDYVAAVLLDRAMRPLLAAPGSANASDVEVQALLRALPTSRDVLETNFHGNPEGRIHADLLVPILDGNEPTPVGAILLQINPNKTLFPLLQVWPVPSETAETLIFFRDGNEIVFLNKTRHGASAALTMRRPLDDPRVLAAKIARGEAGAIDEGEDYRGVPVVGVGRAIPGTPWMMVAKMDQAEAYAPLREEASRMAMLTMARLGVLALVAGLIWRQRSNEILRRELVAEKAREMAAKRLAHVTQHVNDSILTIDEHGRILEANHRALETYGYTLEELRALPSGGLRPPGERESLPQQFELFRAPGGGVYETTHQRKDGSIFPVEVSGSAFELDGRTVRLGVFRDISQRKANEEKIAGLSRIYAALSHVNQTIVRATSREQLLAEICRVLVEFGQFKMAWIGWRDPATEIIEPVAVSGDEFGYIKAIRIYADDRPEGRGPIGRAFREARPVFGGDFASDPTTSLWHEPAQRCGFGSVAALPVRQVGAVVGTLNVYAAEKSFFGDQEIALLNEAAEDVSFALDNLEHEVRRREAEHRVSDALNFNSTLIENLPVGILAYNETGQCFAVNDALIRMLGGTKEQILAQNFRALASWKSSGLLAAAEAAFATEAEQDIEANLTTSFGKNVRLACRFAPFIHEGKRHLLVVTTDVTARHAAEEQLVLLNTAMLAAPNCIMITDERGSIEWVNPAFASETGYTLEEAVGKNPRFLNSGRQPKEFYEAMWRTISGGRNWRGEMTNRRKDGSLYTEDATIAPVRDAAGTIKHFVAIKQDITARKEAEAALRTSEERLKLALAATGTGVWEWNAQTNAVFWSQECFDVIGGVIAEKTFEAFLKFVHPDDLEAFHAAVNQSLSQKTVFIHEFRAVRPDGKILWLQNHGTAEFGDTGKPARMIGTVRDITERKQAEEALRARNDELERFNRASVGRELRMIELKREINALYAAAGQPKRFSIESAARDPAEPSLPRSGN